MSEDLTGRRLGHYRVDGVIGKGGMSVMYRATDVRLGRKVALKVIAEHLTGDPEFRERFVDEARNTSAIDHSHVVPLYDFGETDGLLYIAMRYVEGADLATVVKDGPLAPARVIALLGQVAEALDSLHGRGLVHLDVKPANVLVTTRESVDAEHVYLADFGLTRRGATGHRTSSGDFLGSPTYAAPEHLRGEPVDPRTDQYALACVMFACLTGRPPFRGKVPEVIQGHLNGTPPAVSAQVELPPSIDDVVRRGMSKDLRARYAHCREFVAAARQALSGVARPGVPAARRPDAPPPGPGRSGAMGGPSGPSGSISGPSGPSGASPSGSGHSGGHGAQPAPTAPPPQPPSGAARAGIAGESAGIPTQGGSGRVAPPRPPGPGGPLQAGPAQHAQPPHGQTSGLPSGSGPPRQPPRRPVGPPPPPPSSAAPMRLRDPLPAGVPSFATRDARDRPWLLPLAILLGLLVVAAVVVAVVVVGGGDDEPPPPPPSVQMDDGGQTLPSDLQVPTR